jgi:hypothetical protein
MMYKEKVALCSEILKRHSLLNLAVRKEAAKL